MFFDTHTHYGADDEPFPGWYRRAEEARVPALLICSSGWENTHLSRQCAGYARNIYYAAGLHPEDVSSEVERKHPAEDYAEFVTDPKCVAIGEIGLDYYYDNAPEQMQRDLLESFLQLALRCDKPAVIHCRDKSDSGPAYEHMFAHLEPYAKAGGRFVLHAYAGSPEWLDRFLALGAFFGIGGMVTFKKADNIRLLAEKMPLDRILLETDAPYLAPVPFRGKRNHPEFLPYTASALAVLRGVAVAELEDLTTNNAVRFFRTGERHE